MKKKLLGLGLIGLLASAMVITPHAEELEETTPVVEETTIVEEETIIEETVVVEETQEVVSVEEVISKLEDSYNTIKTFLIGAIGAEALFALFVIGKVALAYLKKNRDRIAHDKETAELLGVIETKINAANNETLKRIEAVSQDKAREAEKQAKAYEDKLLQIVENAKLD